jgi:unsaturated rhamnogalacturonyl hydrolase
VSNWKTILWCVFGLLTGKVSSAKDHTLLLNEKMAATVMQIWPDSFHLEGKKTATWAYDLGVILKGFEGLWMQTGNPAYFNYLQKQIDFFVQSDGSIKTYKKEEYNIDHINNGKLLLTLYRATGKEKYKKAADLLREQLRTHPRTKQGGFWHKQIYPWQMWLDGLYMGTPFYAEYAMLFKEEGAFDDIINQFVWMEQHARDANTGLLYHGWDESREQAWANKQTGTSPHFWARAMGWYANALVDVLDYVPANHPRRETLIQILNRLVAAIQKQQHPETGLWYDIMAYDGPGKEKNYFEASAACQFVYAVAKGVRMGYLSSDKALIAEKGWNGIVGRFVKTENGQTILTGTVKVSGLGGKPYRDGSFAYYMSEPIIDNDPKGLGAFLLAANEMNILPNIGLGKNKTILLDRYFNSETRKNAVGHETYWHYTWEERSNPGFYTFGQVWRFYGANPASLDAAPDKKNLKNKSVYIIVDPDHPKDNPSPNFMSGTHAKAIAGWVKKGGVLVLMANDSGNCDLTNFNLLAQKFGMRFNDANINMVQNNQFEQGLVISGTSGGLFPVSRNLFIKEISGIDIIPPAIPLIKSDGNVLMATARYGKGLVFAVGDPWLYNEYVDGRKLPARYENYHAMHDLVKWLLKAVPKK